MYFRKVLRILLWPWCVNIGVQSLHYPVDLDFLVWDCSNSISNALELLLSDAKPSISWEMGICNSRGECMLKCVLYNIDGFVYKRWNYITFLLHECVDTIHNNKECEKAQGDDIDGLVEDCGNSIADKLEFCTKSFMSCFKFFVSYIITFFLFDG